MTLDPHNLPTLHRRLSYLEGQYRIDLDAIGSDKYRTDSVLAREIDELRNEIDELTYVLDFFQTVRIREARRWERWQTLVIATVALVSLILSLVMLWRG